MHKLLENQYKNMFLYVPFLLSFGAGAYFASPFEPSFICVLFLASIITLLLFYLRRTVLLRGILIILFGFCYACIFAHVLNTPVLPHTQNERSITGIVRSVDYAYDKVRLNIKTNLDDQDMNIRVSVMDDVVVPNAGDEINATVTLFRPSASYAPETFDYARWAYFNKLSATGYMTQCKVVDKSDFNLVNDARTYIHNRSNSFLVDSLVLGYKKAVSETDSKIWTSTGIGHVWSISGFHMTLVGGWLFALFYFLFRRIPYITRRIPAKIPAMCFAWIGLLIYLFLSGTDTATVRAFLMTTLIFAAFIFGRSAISMRNVALAYCAIFFINPHSVMHAGFQLSFAAVFAIVWLFCDYNPRMPTNKIFKAIYIAFLTTVVATIFTAPFIAAHFGAIPVYTLLGNLLLLPVFSFAIMPLVMVGCICAMFGFTGLLDIADMIYQNLIHVATWISELPFSTITVRHVSNLAILLFVISEMCLILIRPIKTRINVVGFVLFYVLGIITVIYSPKPIFYATSDHELVGFVGDDGLLGFNKSRASHHYFAFDTWKALNGQELGTKNKRIKPTNGVWRFESGKFNLVYVQKFTAIQKNILNFCVDDTIDYIVSYSDIDSVKCKNKILKNGFVIYPSGRIKYTPSNRPWNHSRHE